MSIDAVTDRPRPRPTAVKPPTATRTLRDLPGPRGWPLIGNLLEIDRDRTHLSLEKFCREHGPLFSFRLGPQRCLGVGEPEHVRTLMLERPHDFRRINTMESVAKELGMHGVFTAEGDEWKRQRSMIAPAFRGANLASHFDGLRTICERYVSLLERDAAPGVPFDPLRDLTRLTVDVMVEVSFDRDLNTLERGPDELQRHFETIFPMLLRRTLAPVPYWRYMRLPADRKLDRAVEAAQAAVLPMIERARTELKGDPARRTKPRSLVESMIAAASESNDGVARLTNEEVFANVLTLLIAGEDTTAYLIAWMLYFLAKHPDIQEELRAEVGAVLGSARTLPSYAAASDLRFLGAVAHETLRLKGPAPLVALAAARDTQLGDIALPAGTPVFALLRQMALQSASFPEPEVFEPARWLTTGDSGQRATLARESLPFGAGPRVCPGRQIALLECTVVISAVIKSFELALPTGLEVREAFDFAMKPENLRLILRPRELRG